MSFRDMHYATKFVGYLFTQPGHGSALDLAIPDRAQQRRGRRFV